MHSPQPIIVALALQNADLATSMAVWAVKLLAPPQFAMQDELKKVHLHIELIRFGHGSNMAAVGNWKHGRPTWGETL